MAEAEATATTGPRRRRRQSFAQRLEAARVVIGYTEADEARVRATGTILAPSADAIAGSVYRYLLSHPETAAYFILPDGRPDRAHLEARQQSLKAWLLSAIEAPLDERAATYLAGIGLAHTRRGGHLPTGVKGRHLLATISFVQTALIGLLDAAIADRAELLATIDAWNKLLMIHLDLFLAVRGSAEGNPHWY